MSGRLRRLGMAVPALAAVAAVVTAAAIATSVTPAGHGRVIAVPSWFKHKTGAQHRPTKTSNLFLVRGADGALQPRGHGRYRLVLKRVEKESVAFADRPSRQTAVVATKLFFQLWKTEFKGSPPNAALVLPGSDPRHDTFVFELGAPKFDEAHGTVFFPVRLLKATPSRFTYLRSRLDTKPPRTFGRATLFVDYLSESQSYCGVAIQNTSPYTLTTPMTSGGQQGSYVNATFPLWSTPIPDPNAVGWNIWPSTPIQQGEAGGAGIEGFLNYEGCAMSLVMNSLPSNSDGSSMNGDLGVYIEFDYTGASQYECVSTGALNVSCRFVQNGDSMSTWASAALGSAGDGSNQQSSQAQTESELTAQILKSTGPATVTVEVTVSTRGGSQWPLCQASSGDPGCPNLLGGYTGPIQYPPGGDYESGGYDGAIGVT